MSRRNERLEGVSAFLLGLYPPVGAALGALLVLLRRSWRLSGRSDALWAGFAAPLAALQLAAGRPADALYIALLGLGGYLGSILLQSRARSVARGLFAALAALALLGVINLALGSLSWSSARVGAGPFWSPGVLEGELTRRWRALGPLEEAELHLTVRALEGTQGWAWYRSHPGIALRRGGAGATHAAFPSDLDPYLMRWVDTGAPLGGRTFEAQAELRAAQPIPAQANRGLWLQVWEARGAPAEVTPTALTPEWQTFTVHWRVPDEMTDSVLRVILNDFDGLEFEIGSVALYEIQDGRRRALGPLAPTGVTLTLAAAGVSRQLTLEPRPEPTQHSLQLGDIRSDWLAVTASAEPGLRVQLSEVGLRVGPGRLVPLPGPTREALWFGHPNLLGHTAAALGLVLLALEPRLGRTLAGAALALGVVGLSGSRAAGLAALLGALWALSRFRRRAALLLGAGVLLLAALIPALSRLSDSGADAPTPRPLIWAAAWQGALEHPLTGVGPDFAAYFADTRAAESNEPVQHAHNLWLHFAVSYGFPGLAAILWLTGDLVLLAWRWGRWRGLGLVLPVLLMNVFDYTLFYGGVLYPLILGLNALRQRPPLYAPPPGGDNERGAKGLARP